MEDFAPHLVGRWMSSGVITTKSDAVLFDVFEIMHSERIRHMPVVDDGKLVGMVSNRDVMRLAMGPAPSRGFEPLQQGKVSEVMTKRVHTVDTHTTVREASEIMCREKISALPVVQGNQLLGIVTSEDLLWSYLERPEPEPEE